MRFCAAFFSYLSIYLFICLFPFHVKDLWKILEIHQKSFPRKFAAHDIYLGSSEKKKKKETSKELIARGH